MSLLEDPSQKAQAAAAMDQCASPANFPADPWAHRSAGMRCMTCMWFVAKQSNGLKARQHEVGRCRRHAPSMGGYPVVLAADWCGDHRLDENK